LFFTSAQLYLDGSFFADCELVNYLGVLPDTQVNSEFHLAEGKVVTVACVGWQMTLCETVCQVTLRSSEIALRENFLHINIFL